MPGQRQPHAAGAALLHRHLTATRQSFQDFAYTVAHDLNAPLRCIASFSQLLEERCGEALDDKGRHYIDLIHDSSRKAQARIAALLQYARLETEPMKRERLEGAGIVNAALSQLEDAIEEREAKIRVTPLPQVIGDSERLTLLFYCLLSNALKFSHARPEIDISARRGHQAWVFAVRDNGIGIEPAHHDSVFAIFRRLHGDDAYCGTGIGLALAKRIAELHGGIIWVDSQAGRGACFCFTLPDTVPPG